MKKILLLLLLGYSFLTTTLQADNAEAFVSRFYTEVLHRSADAEGLQYWTDKLKDGSKTGADIAYGFIFSEEYNLNAKSNEAYLKTLYKAFFNRAPDSAGFAFWINTLNHGTSKTEVLDGFLHSDEFATLSQSFGIVPAKPQNSVQGFVERFYTEVLGRTSDREGLAYWTSQLESHALTGEDVARGFVQSQEFDNKGLNNETYVKTLYQSFFGREADEGGFYYWVNELNHGVSREDILNGFLHSQEFKNLSNSYGIIATRDQRDNGESSLHQTLQPPLREHIYVGAFADFGGSEDKVSKEKIKNFETLIGKKIAWAYFSNNWYNGIVYPKAKIHAIYDAGVVPFVRLMPRSNDMQGQAEKHFSLQNIIDGDFDTELKAWARAAKKDAIPLLMDFAVEPNGDWFGWSGLFNGGAKTDGYGDPNYPDGPERYRDAYRHIISLFRAEGATDVTWFFHYNYASSPDVAWNKPRYYYPGDAYIDWVGCSLYGAQTLDEVWDGLAFSTQLATYAEDANAITSSKPRALLEFGVTDHHPQGSKSTWFNDAFATILSNPYIKFDAISFWHENWENEDGSYSTLRVDSSSESMATVKEWIANKRFVSVLRF